jgi:hypothetical protein
MAEFCNQCALILEMRPGDLKNLPEGFRGALCERCGPTEVDVAGNCVAHNHEGDRARKEAQP